MYASLEVWMVSHAFGSLSRLKETPCVTLTLIRLPLPLPLEA